MYKDLKQAIGKPTKKSALLKSKIGEVITDKDKQMGWWVEHYLELHPREHSVRKKALDDIEDLTVLAWKNWTEPTEEEPSKAIDTLACEKGPGEDGMPPDIKFGKPALLKSLHNLLRFC